MRKFPEAAWMLGMHVRVVAPRLDTIKSSITSTYGSILKIDLTKKVGI